MLNEPTTIASVARLIGVTLRTDYDVDPEPLFAAANIDTTKFHRPGSRILQSKMNTLWLQAYELTGDDEFGVKVGLHVAPGDFFVLGHAWLASDTLLDAMQRLCRFINVLSTIGNQMYIRKQKDIYLRTCGNGRHSKSRPSAGRQGRRPHCPAAYV
jgi:hypothetical protein